MVMKMKVGIKIQQEEHLEDLIKVATPIFKDFFKQKYGDDVKIEGRVNKNGSKNKGFEIYADIPEPNGNTIDLISGLDKNLYVPMVENHLTEGYDFVLGNQSYKNLWGFSALIKESIKNGNTEEAHKLSEEFNKMLNEYSMKSHKSYQDT